MLDKNIEKEIKCYYFDKCTRANVWSKTSICPRCKNNHWKNPKKNYYEYKYDSVGNILFILCMISIGILVFNICGFI